MSQIESDLPDSAALADDDPVAAPLNQASDDLELESGAALLDSQAPAAETSSGAALEGADGDDADWAITADGAFVPPEFSLPPARIEDAGAVDVGTVDVGAVDVGAVDAGAVDAAADQVGSDEAALVGEAVRDLGATAAGLGRELESTCAANPQALAHIDDYRLQALQQDDPLQKVLGWQTAGLMGLAQRVATVVTQTLDHSPASFARLSEVRPGLDILLRLHKQIERNTQVAGRVAQQRSGSHLQKNASLEN